MNNKKLRIVLGLVYSVLCLTTSLYAYREYVCDGLIYNDHESNIPLIIVRQHMPNTSQLNASASQRDHLIGIKNNLSARHVPFMDDDEYRSLVCPWICSTFS